DPPVPGPPAAQAGAGGILPRDDAAVTVGRLGGLGLEAEILLRQHEDRVSLRSRRVELPLRDGVHRDRRELLIRLDGLAADRGHPDAALLVDVEPDRDMADAALRE